jgi:hypothetical protein
MLETEGDIEFGLVLVGRPAPPTPQSATLALLLNPATLST